MEQPRCAYGGKFIIEPLRNNVNPNCVQRCHPRHYPRLTDEKEIELFRSSHCVQLLDQFSSGGRADTEEEYGSVT